MFLGGRAVVAPRKANAIYPALPSNWRERYGEQRAMRSVLHRADESTVRYLGIDVDDALAISEQVEI